MTADAIFDIVLALMFAEASEKDDYPGFLPILNLFLQETYELNNGLREWAGKEPLPEVPFLTALTDEVPYEGIVVRLLLPYGVAGRLATEENPSMAANFVNKYEFERERMAIKGCFEEVENVYG